MSPFSKASQGDQFTCRHHGYEADERCLSILKSSSADYIFEITVFQHIDPEVMKKYLETAYAVLEPEGVIILQFLMNPYKNPLRR